MIPATPPAGFLRGLLLIALLAAPAGFSAAQEAGTGGGPSPQAEGAAPEIITALSITGLKRTRLSTAEKPLRRFIGRRADQVDLDEARAAILADGILEPLSLEIRDADDGTGKVLAAEIREKWSIIPIPVFMAGSGGIRGGGAFFDANAFGINDKLFVAAIFGSGWLASAGYIHSSPRWLSPGWTVTGSFSRQERRDKDLRGNDLRVFTLDAVAAGAGLNMPLLENSDILNASLSLGYEEKILRDEDKAVNGPDLGARYLGAGGGLSLGRSVWDGYLLSQEELSLRYTWMAALTGPSFHTVRLRLTYEKSLIPGFRLNLRSGLAFDPGAPVLFESSPSSAQVSILPSSFSARHYAGASLGFEKYLFKFSAGTLSLSAAYQLAWSQGSVLGDSLDHGVSGMVSFYLSRIAIPALGLGFAYNVDKDYLQGSFSLGMSL
jgi:hypothetical protein